MKLFSMIIMYYRNFFASRNYKMAVTKTQSIEHTSWRKSFFMDVKFWILVLTSLHLLKISWINIFRDKCCMHSKTSIVCSPPSTLWTWTVRCFSLDITIKPQRLAALLWLTKILLLIYKLSRYYQVLYLQ